MGRCEQGRFVNRCVRFERQLVRFAGRVVFLVILNLLRKLLRWDTAICGVRDRTFDCESVGLGGCAYVDVDSGVNGKVFTGARGTYAWPEEG